MELKPGYKQTEVGIIPADWNQSAIGAIATKVGSGITPRGRSSRYKAYGRPFVRSQNVGWGNLNLDDLAYIDDETHNTFSDTELKQGDVLLNITGASIGQHIYKRDIYDLEVRFPDIDQQNQIRTVLDGMDAEISALEAKVAKYRQLKQGMMHNLLIGKIRLK